MDQKPNTTTKDYLRETASRRKKNDPENEEKIVPLPTTEELTKTSTPMSLLNEPPVLISNKEVLISNNQPTLISNEQVLVEWSRLEQSWDVQNKTTRKKLISQEKSKLAASKIREEKKRAQASSSVMGSIAAQRPPSRSTLTGDDLFTSLTSRNMVERMFRPEPNVWIGTSMSGMGGGHGRGILAQMGAGGDRRMLSDHFFSPTTIRASNLFSMPSSQQQRPINGSNNALQRIMDFTLNYPQPTAHRGSEGASLLPVTLPTATVTTTAPSSATSTQETITCPICLETKEENTSAVWNQMPCCKAYIHSQCAKSSLRQDMRCPLCRKLVP